MSSRRPSDRRRAPASVRARAPPRSGPCSAPRGTLFRRLFGRQNDQNRHVIFYGEERFRRRQCPHRPAQLPASIVAQDPAPGKPEIARRFFAVPSIRPPTTLSPRAGHQSGCPGREIARFAPTSARKVRLGINGCARQAAGAAVARRARDADSRTQDFSDFGPFWSVVFCFGGGNCSVTPVSVCELFLVW